MKSFKEHDCKHGIVIHDCKHGTDMHYYKEDQEINISYFVALLAFEAPP
jgi:hypothetical protein